ncbi:MAG: BrnT family toxin [Candidatus Binatia bacterium]
MDEAPCFRYILKIRFDWDAGKAASNLRKHGIRFEDAMTAFDDPDALVAPDPAHSTAKESREWLIGESDTVVLVVVFTVRQPGDVHRLISARPASRQERKRYEEAKGIPF